MPEGRTHVKEDEQRHETRIADALKARPVDERVATAAETVFRLDDVHVYYGSFLALRGVTLDVGKNEITAFIGPSGCGKSTLIRCLNRMNDLIPGARVEGKIEYHDQDLYGDGVDPVEVRRRIGMVFQKPNPFPKSIYEHNALALSGGQQQRLCIARAIAVSPDVILMDEPCSALDPVSTARIEDLMEEYTIVIVTHNMQQAARVSDRTAFFTAEAAEGTGDRTGLLVEYDRTDAIFTHPSDKRTEDYITGRFG